MTKLGLLTSVALVVTALAVPVPAMPGLMPQSLTL